MVVESRIAMKQKGLSKRSLGETEDSYLASEVRLALENNICTHHTGNVVNLALYPSLARQAHVGPVMTSSQHSGIHIVHATDPTRTCWHGSP